jgi:hypothetical protein
MEEPKQLMETIKGLEFDKELWVILLWGHILNNVKPMIVELLKELWKEEQTQLLG